MHRKEARKPPVVAEAAAPRPDAPPLDQREEDDGWLIHYSSAEATLPSFLALFLLLDKGNEKCFPVSEASPAASSLPLSFSSAAAADFSSAFFFFVAQ